MGKFALVLFLSLVVRCSAASGATITVNATGDDAVDDGVCTLREAIVAANTNTASGASAGECGGGDASPSVDRIQFNLSGPGIPTITPNSALPTVTEEVSMDGTSQGAGFVEINGTNAGTDVALDIATNDSEIRGFVINRFNPNGFNGAVIVNGERNVIAGNRIGTNSAGTAASANGIGVVLRAANNRVGGVVGTSPGGYCTGDCNLLSGNKYYGIATRAGTLVSINNVIQGNFIGVDVTGKVAIGNNSTGTDICSANNQIGGTTAAARNLVSGNSTVGICVGCGCTSGSGNIIEGNYVGVDTTGTVAIGGHSNAGVITKQARIGGDTGLSSKECTGACNLISGNESGIRVRDDNGEIIGNFIGTSRNGRDAIPNATTGIDINEDGWMVRRNVIAFNGAQGITRNSSVVSEITGNRIFSNGALGIDVDADDVTNDLLATIVRVDTLADQIQAVARVTGTAGVEYSFEFFSSTECDPSGFGEGEFFLGRTSAIADGSGIAEATLSASSESGGFFTVTVTDRSTDTTFEFSECAVANTAAPTVSQLGILFCCFALFGIAARQLWPVPRSN